MQSSSGAREQRQRFLQAGKVAVAPVEAVAAAFIHVRLVAMHIEPSRGQPFGQFRDFAREARPRPTARAVSSSDDAQLRASRMFAPAHCRSLFFKAVSAAPSGRRHTQLVGAYAPAAFSLRRAKASVR